MIIIINNKLLIQYYQRQNFLRVFKDIYFLAKHESAIQLLKTELYVKVYILRSQKVLSLIVLYEMIILDFYGIYYCLC